MGHSMNTQIHTPNVPYTAYRWMQTIVRNHGVQLKPSVVVSSLSRSKYCPFSLDIEFHKLFLNHHRHTRGKALSPSCYPLHWWTRRTCSIQCTSIARGVQCRSSSLLGYTQNSGTNVVDCPVLSQAHLIRIRGSIGSQGHSWSRSYRSL